MSSQDEEDTHHRKESQPNDRDVAISQEAVPSSSKSSGNDSDQEFDPSAEMMANDFDDEQTLDEEEEEEGMDDEGDEHEDEIDALNREGEMPIEQLLAMYSSMPHVQHHLDQQDGQGDEDDVDEDSTSLNGGTREGIDRPMSMSSGHEVHLYGDDDDYEDDSDDDYCDGDGEGEDFERNRKQIMIGPTHQADIPDMESYDDAPPYENEDTLLWTPPDEMTDPDFNNYYLRHGRDHRPANPITSIVPPSHFVTPLPPGDDSHPPTHSTMSTTTSTTITMCPDEESEVGGGDAPSCHPVMPPEEDHPQVPCATPMVTSSHRRITGIQLKGTSRLNDDEEALFSLMQCGYDVREALRRKGHRSGKFDLMTPWSEEEASNFENAFRDMGKHFHNIRDMVSTRSVAEIVNFYYMWKKSDRFDVFVSTFRTNRLDPEVEDVMDTFIEEGDAQLRPPNGIGIGRSHHPSNHHHLPHQMQGLLHPGVSNANGPTTQVMTGGGGGGSSGISDPKCVVNSSSYHHQAPNNIQATCTQVCASSVSLFEVDGTNNNQIVTTDGSNSSDGHMNPNL